MCKTCNPGTYVPSYAAPGNSTGDCQVCPTGTNKSSNAGFRACPCLKDYFRRDRFGPCNICPKEGVDCSDEAQRLKPGFWWTWSFDLKSLKNYQCFAENLKIEIDYEKNCSTFHSALPKPLPCPGGKVACPVHGDSINVSCAPGYTGWLCSQCTTTHYPWFEYCFACPSAWHFALECLGVLIIIFLFVLVGIWDHKRKRSNKRTVVDILIARFKIILGYYQVIGAMFSSFHDVQWPKQMSNLGAVLRLLELNMFKLVAKPSCYFPTLHLDIYNEYVIGVCFCGLIVTVSLSVYTAHAIFVHRIRSRRSDVSREIQRASMKLKCCLFVVFMLYVTYLSVCNVIVALLPAACYKLCLDENDNHCSNRLRSDPSIDCDSRIHHKYTYAAYASFAYIVGFPLVLLALLSRYSKKKDKDLEDVASNNTCSEEHGNVNDEEDPIMSNDPGNHESGVGTGSISALDNVSPCQSSNTPADEDSILVEHMEDETSFQDERTEIDDNHLADLSESYTGDRRNYNASNYPLYLRFLCENYKEEFWYWEILELVRKVFQTVLVVVFGSQDSLTLGITLALSVIFLTSHAYYKPMKDRFEHWLQMVSLAAIFFNLLMASMLLMGSKSHASPTHDIVLIVFIVALNVLVFGMAVGK